MFLLNTIFYLKYLRFLYHTSNYPIKNNICLNTNLGKNTYKRVVNLGSIYIFKKILHQTYFFEKKKIKYNFYLKGAFSLKALFLKKLFLFLKLNLSTPQNLIFCIEDKINICINENVLKGSVLILKKERCKINPKLKKNLFFEKFFFEKRIALQRQVIFKKKEFNFINSFLFNFLNFFLKKKVYLIFKKLNKAIKHVDYNEYVDFILWKIQKRVGKRKGFVFLSTFYKVLFLSFKLKDSNFFLKWYIRQEEATYYKQHKFMVYLLEVFLKGYHGYIFANSNSKGVFFYIGGKIGVTGDSKKRHIYMNYGKHSVSSKKIKLDCSKGQVKTETGVMGLRFNIFF